MSKCTQLLIRGALLAGLVLSAACSGSKDPQGGGPAGSLKITSFSVDKTAVSAGEKVTLTWAVSGTTNPRIDISATPGGSVLQGSTTPEGTVQSLALAANTVFRLTLTADGKSVEATVSVSVAAVSAVRVTSFTAAPNPGPLGGRTTLSWTTVGATSLRITRSGQEVYAGTDTTIASGSFAATIDQASNVFALEISDGIESATAEVTVTAVAPAGETEPNNDPATPNPLGAGGMMGAIDPAGDVDHFAVDIPEGGNVWAQTSDGQDGCNLDTVLALVAPDGTELGFADEGGPGNCSLIDPRFDGFAANLPAGRYLLIVRGWSEEITGAYSLVATVGTAGCGNGVLEGREACDDGNTDGLDCCSNACEAVIAARVSGTGGTAVVTLGAYPASALIEVTTAIPGQSISVNTGDQNGNCDNGLDTMVALSSAETFLGYTLDSVTSSCAAFLFPTDAFAIDLASGTHLLEVTNEGAAGATIQVTVTIHSPTCGNGAKETLANEQCDDGNTSGGDACSATCTIDSLATVSGPGQRQVFMNSLPAGGEHFYRVEMASMGSLFLDTFVGSPGMCTGEATDLQLDLLDSAFAPVGTDNDDGEGLCAKIDPAVDQFARLAAGSYYVRVWQWDSSIPTPSYGLIIDARGVGCGNGILESGEECDDGTTAGGDGCSATCTFEGNIVRETEPNDASGQGTQIRPTQTPITAAGSITPVADVDFYGFEVPAGQTLALSARTYSAIGQPTMCNNSTTDTKLTLLAADGTTEITSNDDYDAPGGRAYCSFIDGSTDAAARIPAGRYFLRVEHYAGFSEIGSYFLDVALLP